MPVLSSRTTMQFPPPCAAASFHNSSANFDFPPYGLSVCLDYKITTV